MVRFSHSIMNLSCVHISNYPKYNNRYEKTDRLSVSCVFSKRIEFYCCFVLFFFLVVLFLLRFLFWMMLQLVTNIYASQNCIFLSSMFQGFCSLQKCCTCHRDHRNVFARLNKFTTNHHFVKPAVGFLFCFVFLRCCSTFLAVFCISFILSSVTISGDINWTAISERWQKMSGDGKLRNNLQQRFSAGQELAALWFLLRTWNTRPPECPHLFLFMLLQYKKSPCRLKTSWG